MTDIDRQHGQFVELLEVNSKRLYSYVRTLVLNDANDAEDIYQNTCMVAWTKFDDYESNSNFGAWICRIAYYEVLRQRDSRRRIRFFSEEALSALADAAMPIAERVKDRREALAECVEKLTKGDVKMIETRYFEATLPKEISRRTGRSVHSVYRQLKRINRLLLHCVERNLESEAVR